MHAAGDDVAESKSDQWWLMFRVNPKQREAPWPIGVRCVTRSATEILYSCRFRVACQLCITFLSSIYMTVRAALLILGSTMLHGCCTGLGSIL